MISYVGQKSRTDMLALAENIWTGDVLNFFAAKEKFPESFCQSITSGSDKKDEIYRITGKTFIFHLYQYQ